MTTICLIQCKSLFKSSLQAKLEAPQLGGSAYFIIKKNKKINKEVKQSKQARNKQDMWSPGRYLFKVTTYFLPSFSSLSPFLPFSPLLSPFLPHTYSEEQLHSSMLWAKSTKMTMMLVLPSKVCNQLSDNKTGIRNFQGTSKEGGFIFTRVIRKALERR